MKLVTAKELAQEINFSEWWVCQAKKAGLPFACGKSCVEWAMTWIQAHPDFVAAEYVTTPSNSSQGRPRKVVGKSDESTRLHDSQISSPEKSERPSSQVV